jgi:hypothetical protein
MKTNEIINVYGRSEEFDLTRYGCTAYQLQAKDYYLEERIIDIENLLSMISEALAVAPHLSHILDLNKIKTDHKVNHEKTISALNDCLASIKKHDKHHPGSIKELLEYMRNQD